MNNLKYIRLSKIKKISYISLSDNNALDNCANMLKNNTNMIIVTSDLSDKLNCENGLKIRQLTSIYDALLIVKNRLDLAKILESDGILLDENSFDIKYAKKYLNDEYFFGYDNTKIAQKTTSFFDNFDFLILLQNNMLNLKILAENL